MRYKNFKKDFDPVAYWSRKPYCIICKKRKVKYGNICQECQQKGNWEGKSINPSQAQDFSEKELVKKFEAESVERKEASGLLRSVVGYLKDCALAILRSVALVNIDNTKDVSFLPVSPEAIEMLDNDGIKLENKEAFDLLYRVISRPNEFDLLFGTLFFKGTKEKKGSNKPIDINAPLLYLRLEGTKTQDNKVIFTLKEDTVLLNQALISEIVNIKDESELEVRFYDLYEAVPTWPLDLNSIKQFLINLSNYFPEVIEENKTHIKGFINYDEIESEKGKIKICPVHCIIVAPKQEAEGTVVEELGLMLKNLLDKTAADYIFSEGVEQVTDAPSDESGKDISEAFEEETGDEWHDLFPLNLSDTQKKIVLSARKNPLTVVSGPPGTGKSYTIVSIILDHLLAGKRVLFTSRMDKAVEIVISWLEEFAGKFSVARSGGRRAQRSLAEKLDLLTGPNSPVKPVNQKELKDLSEQYEKTQEKIDNLEKEFLDLLVDEREWSIISDGINNISKKIKTDKNFPHLEITEDKALKLKEKTRGADFLIKNKKFFIQTWWGNSTLNRIKKQLGVSEGTTVEELIAITERIANERKKEKIEKEIEKFEEINKLWSEIHNFNQKLKNLAFEILKRTLLGNLYLIVNNHYKRVEIRNFIKSLRSANVRHKVALRSKVSTDTLLSSFPCWASTTFHLSQILPLEPGMFDLVIFDEASQCDLASATPALYRANKALIVGDPKQLTHVVFLGKQTEFAAFANNGVPPEAQATFRFTTRSLFDVAEDKVQQNNYFMLDEHFRSEPHIISFSNKKFYEEKLRIMTQRPVVKSEDSIAIQVKYVDGRRTVGTVNPKEIEAIFQHVKEQLALSVEEKPTTIGILCPFRDQVDAISKELPQHLTLEQVEKHKIVIGTAHSLQGDEKDVVILSFSLDPDYHHGTLQFLEKPNVFNVAITRAKKKLIVISSVRIKDLPNGLLKDFLLHAESSLGKTLPLDKFESKFEREVAEALKKIGYNIWPQYEAAGFSIDLVVGNNNNYIAVECDGPTHFDLRDRQNFYDVWRQQILERAGWRFVRISYREWEKDKKLSLKKVKDTLSSFSI